MATTEDIEQYLRKRGYETQISEKGDAYIIELRSRSVDEVANVLASIHEGKRFIVTLLLSDIAELVLETGHIPEQFKAIKNRVEDLEDERERWAAAETELWNMRLGLKDKFAQLEQVNASHEKRLAVLEKKPWWRRIGRKS